jgi:hypothetical protein
MHLDIIHLHFALAYLYFVWVWNLVSHFRGRAKTEGVLRGVFGPKREEVGGGWRRLHNEELHNLYTSQNIIRMTKSRMIIRMEHIRNTYKMLVGKSE